MSKPNNEKNNKTIEKVEESKMENTEPKVEFKEVAKSLTYEERRKKAIEQININDDLEKQELIKKPFAEMTEEEKKGLQYLDCCIRVSKGKNYINRFIRVKLVEGIILTRRIDETEETLLKYTDIAFYEGRKGVKVPAKLYKGKTKKGGDYFKVTAEIVPNLYFGTKDNEGFLNDKMLYAMLANFQTFDNTSGQQGVSRKTIYFVSLNDEITEDETFELF